jgi:hypothetical protein
VKEINGQVENTLQMMISHDAICDVLHCHGAQRGWSGGLPDNRVSANGRKCAIPGPHGDGEVKGGDDSDNTQRVPLLHHPVSGTFRSHCQPIKLTGKADGEIAYIDHLLDFAVPFRSNLPHFQANEITQWFLQFAQRIAQIADDFAPFGRGNHSPSIKSAGGFGHDTLIRCGAGLDDFGNGIPG